MSGGHSIPWLTGRKGKFYQQNEDGDGLDDFTLQPDFIVKLGLGYTAESWSLGLFDTYTASYQYNDIVVTDPVRANPDPDSYHRLSANLRFDLPSLPGWAGEIYVDNILDEDVYLPAVPGDAFGSGPLAINSQMVMSGRSFVATISKSF